MVPPRRGRLVAGAVLAVLAAFYVWTALTSADPGIHGGRIDPYNRQATAFLHGHLHLLTPPPRALLRLRDPYDPRQALPVEPADIRDLTLYHGRLYTYWGPVPALVAFIPFRVLGVGDLSPAVALLAFALVALLFQWLLLRLLAARFAPRAPGWLLLTGLAVVALGDAMPFMLRTPQVYEVAIGAGACFASAALYCFARAGLVAPRPPALLLAAGSLCAGLAFGSRPPQGLVIVFGLLAAAVAWRAAAGGRARLAVATLAPFAICVAAIGAYNAARFGSPTEFGLRYTLTGFDIRDAKLGHLSFLPPGLWYYLLQPLRPRLEFPFAWLGPPPFYPASVPAAYEAPEKVAGIVWSVPFALVVLAVPFLVRRWAASLRAVVVTSMACGAVLMAFAAYYQPVATERYEVDFLVYLAPVAALVWLVALSATTRRRRLLAGVGGVLAAWTILIGVAASLVGYDDALRRHHPGQWSALRTVFSPVPHAAVAIAGRPLVVAVGHDPVDPRPWHVLSLDLDGASFRVDPIGTSVQVLAPHAMRATLHADVRAPRTVRRLTVAANGHRATAPATGAIHVTVALRGGRNDVVLRPLGAGAPVDVSGLTIR